MNRLKKLDDYNAEMRSLHAKNEVLARANGIECHLCHAELVDTTGKPLDDLNMVVHCPECGWEALRILKPDELPKKGKKK